MFFDVIYNTLWEGVAAKIGCFLNGMTNKIFN